VRHFLPLYTISTSISIPTSILFSFPSAFITWSYLAQSMGYYKWIIDLSKKKKWTHLAHATRAFISNYNGAGRGRKRDARKHASLIVGGIIACKRIRRNAVNCTLFQRDAHDVNKKWSDNFRNISARRSCGVESKILERRIENSYISKPRKRTSRRSACTQTDNDKYFIIHCTRDKSAN